ncbi:MAG: YdcF family protein [Pseudomonadota bacterium]
MRTPDFVLSPLSWALLMAVVLALAWRRLPRALRWAGLAIEVLLVFSMTPLGANALVRMIESRVPPPTACKAPLPTTIVVLSGGTEYLPHAAEDFAALSRPSLQRLLAGLELWRRTPGARLVIAGGGRRIPEAVIMAALAERLGVPDSAIETETKSHTTWENARNVAALSPVVPKRIWLVSSALHLPRALGAFRAWGFEPCAWPSGSMYVPLGVDPGYFVPQSSSLAKAELATHELLGSVVYAGLEWKLRRSEMRAQRAATNTASGQ